MKLVAIALLATAMAGTAQGRTVSITFDGFCNGLNITTSQHNPLVKSVENGCANGAGGGVGVLGKIDGYSGRHYAIGENYDDGAGHYIGEEFWIVSAPVVTGGTYELWRHKTDGRLVKLGAGTYSILPRGSKSAGGERLTAR